MVYFGTGLLILVTDNQQPRLHNSFQGKRIHTNIHNSYCHSTNLAQIVILVGFVRGRGIKEQTYYYLLNPNLLGITLLTKQRQKTKN